MALRVLSCPDSHSHISWGLGKMEQSVLPEAETMEKDCTFHTSERWHPCCHLSVDRDTASSSNLESSNVFSNRGSFGRTLDDAAVIGISNKI